MEKQELSRREFLKLSAAGAAALSVLGISGINISAAENTDSGILRLNPGFGIREISESEIELYTNTGNGKMLTHRFTGLEADIFRQLKDEKSPESFIQLLARKYGMKEAECRDKISSSLREFEKTHLVYRGEKMMVYKREMVRENNVSR